MERPAHDASLGDECTCFKCHIGTIQVSPAATPSRRNSKPPRATTGGGNSWERGVPKDSRGMPYLDPKSGHAIGQKDWAQDKRRKFESAGLA